MPAERMEDIGAADGVVNNKNVEAKKRGDGLLPCCKVQHRRHTRNNHDENTAVLPATVNNPTGRNPKRNGKHGQRTCVP